MPPEVLGQHFEFSLVPGGGGLFARTRSTCGLSLILPYSPSGRAKARLGLFGTLAFIGMVSLWTPFLDTRITARWFSWPNIAFLAPVPIVTAAIGWWLWASLCRGRDIAPFLAAMGLFAMCYLGLAISLFPYVVAPTITPWDAAAAPQSQAFLLIGTLFLLPIILMYTGWSYWVFLGKVRADVGYAP